MALMGAALSDISSNARAAAGSVTLDTVYFLHGKEEA